MPGNYCQVCGFDTVSCVCKHDDADLEVCLWCGDSIAEGEYFYSPHHPYCSEACAMMAAADDEE